MLLAVNTITLHKAGILITLLSIFLLLCDDTELNPGPTKT